MLFSESQLGIHTMRPHPPLISAMCVTAHGFTFVPVVRFDPMPPKISRSGCSLRM